MGRLERKQRQKEEVYDSILNAAWKLVKVDGWQGLSIRKIAEEIEYSIPVIYDHFENKEAILKEFTRQGFKKLNSQLLEAIHISADPVDRLQALTLAYWRFGFGNTEYYQLMYGMGMPSCEMVNEMEEVRDFTGILMSSITELYNGRLITKAEGFVKMKSLWSMLHGLVSIQMMAQHDQQQEPDDEVLNESVRSFIAGLAA